MSENINKILKIITTKTPEQVALVCEEQKLTWFELNRQSNQIANKLLLSGYTKGDRVAIFAENCIQYYLFFLGVVKAGICVVPIPTMISTDAIASMLSDSESTVLIVSRATAEKAQSILDSMPDCSVDLQLGFDVDSGNWNELNKWFECSSTLTPDCNIRTDDEFNIIYSSGTTGRPKGIIHSHRFRLGDAEEMASEAADKKNISVITTALYSNWSVYAFLAAILDGGTAIVMKKYNVRHFLKICELEQPTDVFLVPVQVERLLNLPEFNDYKLGTGTMKHVAGSFMPASTKIALHECWPGGLTELYGMTEGTPSASLEVHKYPDKLESVGLPGEDTKIIIVDDNKNELPIGETGEILGHGQSMMLEYNNMPEQTAELIWVDKEGLKYFCSGDLGHLDQDGFLYINGRKKDMIISGGFNIYPVDLEEVISKHPEVKEVAVIGIPCPEWGETPLALVVLKDGNNISCDELLSWSNVRLGKLQQFRHMIIVDNLLRNVLGKVLKNELKVLYKNFISTGDSIGAVV